MAINRNRNRTETELFGEIKSLSEIVLDTNKKLPPIRKKTLSIHRPLKGHFQHIWMFRSTSRPNKKYLKIIFGTGKRLILGRFWSKTHFFIVPTNRNFGTNNRNFGFGRTFGRNFGRNFGRTLFRSITSLILTSRNCSWLDQFWKYVMSEVLL